jgi:cyclin-dependent kinase-like
LGELTDGEPMFPGDDEIDTLKLIQELIGKMTNKQKKQFF